MSRGAGTHLPRLHFSHMFQLRALSALIAAWKLLEQISQPCHLAFFLKHLLSSEGFCGLTPSILLLSVLDVGAGVGGCPIQRQEI